MKKYAVIVTSLVVFGGVLQTQCFAQADTGSSSSSGAATSSQSGANTSGSSSDKSGLNSSSQSGAAISEPSGAQAGQQQQVGAITIEGTVSSEAEKKSIESQVMQLPGVTSVHNLLQVQGQGGALNEPSGAQGGPNATTNSNPSGTSSGNNNSSSSPQPGQTTP